MAEPANNGQDRNGAAPPAPQPRLSRRGEVLPAYTLSPDQRDKLNLLLELDPAALRRKVTIEVAERAASGQRLAPEIVARLAELIDPPPGNGTAV